MPKPEPSARSILLSKRANPSARSILLSKRANIFYLEHAKILQKGERVVYLTDTGAAIEQFFNIPEKKREVLDAVFDTLKKMCLKIQ